MSIQCSHDYVENAQVHYRCSSNGYLMQPSTPKFGTWQVELDGRLVFHVEIALTTLYPYLLDLFSGIGWGKVYKEYREVVYAWLATDYYRLHKAIAVAKDHSNTYFISNDGYRPTLMSGIETSMVHLSCLRDIYAQSTSTVSHYTEAEAHVTSALSSITSLRAFVDKDKYLSAVDVIDYRVMKLHEVLWKEGCATLPIQKRLELWREVTHSGYNLLAQWTYPKELSDA